MDEISELKQRIAELETQLAQNKRAEEALEAAGFDVWENNFVTGTAFGSNERIFTNIGYSADEVPKTLEELFKFIHPDDLKSGLSAILEHFDGKTSRYQAEMRVRAKDGSWRWVGNYGQVKERDADGKVTKFIGVNFDINQRRIVEEELVVQNRELKEAVEHIKTLQGIIPICSYCKKIRNDQGYWDQVESYISEHTDAEFSHSVCPDCLHKHHPTFSGITTPIV